MKQRNYKERRVQDIWIIYNPIPAAAWGQRYILPSGYGQQGNKKHNEERQNIYVADCRQAFHT